MSRRTILGLPGLLAAAACATGGGVDPSSEVHTPPRVEQSGNTFYINLPGDGQPIAEPIAAPADAAFRALAAAYEELGIPIETIQTATWTLGNRRHRARGRIVGIQMSRIVRCGAGPAGEHADSHMITFDIMTRLRPIGTDSVVVETTLNATARTLDGAGGHTLRCGSTGVLEREIAERIRKRFAA